MSWEMIFHGVVAERQPTLYVFANVDGDVAMPCGLDTTTTNTTNTNTLPRCTWVFCEDNCQGQHVQVSDGQVQRDSGRSGRISVGPDCSLRLARLRPGDAGMYFCYPGGGGERRTAANVFLSLLAVSSDSPLSELRPGGRLALGCLLHTFDDDGNCFADTAVNRSFRLGWVLEPHGSPLPDHPRFDTLASPCNVTLLVTLPEEEDSEETEEESEEEESEGAGLDMSWRCQVTTLTGSGEAVSFLDVSAGFLLRRPRPRRRPLLHGTGTPGQEVVTAGQEAGRCAWGRDYMVPAGRMALFCVAQLVIAAMALHLVCTRSRTRVAANV
ncbi:hypothetical protein CRUP_034211 [Coryphaenoides rupestris]|nr:hypothetical protein CRUP_034211 [Coryphaenoides rupestris]